MACLYKRSGSPFWWIKHYVGGKPVLKSTRLLWTLPGETRKAKAMKIQLDLNEMKGGARKTHGWSWVSGYIEQRYSTSPKTLENYRNRWKNLNAFFEARQILGPNSLTREHCHQFLEWRPNPDVEGIFKASKNTALYEIKLLGLLMKEALQRGIADKNPCYGLGIQQDKPRLKPELTSEEIEKLRKELSRRADACQGRWPRPARRVWPEWMEVAFEIALAQGCRQRECCLPLSDIDLKRGTITFSKVKKDKPYTTRLNPSLVPLIKRLKKEGRAMTCDMPQNPSAYFWRLFHKCGLKHASFHSTRVGVVTKLARGGVSQSLAMRFVGHASETVHRIYQRLSVDDLDGCLKALQNNPPP